MISAGIVEDYCVTNVQDKKCLYSNLTKTNLSVYVLFALMYCRLDLLRICSFFVIFVSKLIILFVWKYHYFVNVLINVDYEMWNIANF